MSFLKIEKFLRTHDCSVRTMKKTVGSNPEETIIGIVKEIEDGHHSAVAVLAEGEYYIVQMDKMGKKLLNEIESKVEVTGTIITDADGTNRITLCYFDVFEPEDDLVDDFNYDGDYNDCCEKDEDNW